MRLIRASEEIIEANPVAHHGACFVFHNDGILLLPPLVKSSNAYFKVMTIGSAKVTIETVVESDGISTGGVDTVESICVGGHQVYDVFASVNWQIFGGCGVPLQDAPAESKPVKRGSHNGR